MQKIGAIPKSPNRYRQLSIIAFAICVSIRYGIINYPHANIQIYLLPHRLRVYVDKEDLDLIKSLLAIIDPKATISGFISNIVADRLDRYKPEIIKMYNDERAKIM